MSKVILITGASKGIGLEIARQLQAQGHVVYGTSRNPNKSDVQDIRLLKLDVQDDTAVTDVVQQVLNENGRIDVLINNAGYDLYGTAEDTSMEELHAQMDTNFYGLVRMTKAVLPTMRRQRSGQIINIGSIGGLISLPLNSAYSASKFALEGYSETLRFEMLPFNVYVSIVQPGQVKTETLGTAFPTTEKQTIFAVEDATQRARTRGGEATLLPKHVGSIVKHIVAKSRPKLRYPVGAQVRFVVALRRYLPERMYESIINQQFVTPVLMS